jgi:hypothetical protein
MWGMTISRDAAARRESARQSTGEFGEHAHSAPELTLATDSPWPADLGGGDGPWGEVSVEYGARTPWGPAQHQEKVADGIVFVPTEGHGGYKLSKERNAAIPRPYRSASGWYEEDTEQHIVVFYHHDVVARQDANRTRDERLAAEDESLRDWYPAAWEKANGRELEPGESRAKDEQSWTAVHGDDYVAVAQQRIEDGLILVTARRSSTGDEDRFVLTAAQRDEASSGTASELGSRGRFVVPNGIKAEPRPEPAPTKPAFTAVPATEGLTAAAAKKVSADLDKRWRLSDDTVLTLRQQIEQGHITGKTVLVDDNGTRKFYLEDGGSGVMAVAKATFDAFEAPDRRTEVDHAREFWQIVQAKKSKAQRAVDGSWRPTSAQYDELRAASTAERDAYDAYKALRDS